MGLTRCELEIFTTIKTVFCVGVGEKADDGVTWFRFLFKLSFQTSIFHRHANEN